MGSGKDGALKVLYLTKTAVGAPWAVRQTRDHVRLGLDAHLAAPTGPRLADYQANGVSTHPCPTDFPLAAPWHAPARFAHLRALVHTLHPDLIHCYHVGSALTARCALGKHHPIPRVFQVPGPLHLEHPLSRRAELATAGPHDYWIGTCHAITTAYHHAGIAADRLFVADYGVDLAAHVAHPPGRLRALLALPPTVPLIGMVGIMYPPKRALGQRRGVKGHEDFIDALARLLPHHPAAHGVIIGGGWGAQGAAYEGRLRRYGQQRCGARLHFLGMRDDVPQLLPDFTLAVQPSHSEGVAGTAVEAQLLGIPVIATAVGGQPDLIVDGETGWLVPPRAPAALAAALTEALGAPGEAARRAAAGRVRAAACFDGATNNAAVVAIYRTILAREGRGGDVPPLRQTAA